ncbi:MAG: hypothetical protein P4M08_04525 [Oligoflexia bacterium]|nr:hypothetical protein [Oligoflexia bacterium]
MLRRCKGVVALGIFVQAAVLSGTAWADFRCATESKGTEFDMESFDPNAAAAAAVEACQASPTTISQECQNNVTCDNGQIQPAVTCYTQSKGMEFNAASEFDSLARLEVAAQCSNNLNTNNQECSTYVVCDDQPQDYPYGTTYVCTAESAGLIFTRQSLFLGLASAEAVGDCEKSPSTYGAECERTVRCAANGQIPVPINPPQPWPQPWPHPWPQPHPWPNPHPWPGPHPDPGPHPGPHPGPDPHPGPHPGPGPQPPHPRDEVDPSLSNE